MSSKDFKDKPDLSLIPYTFYKDLPDDLLEFGDEEDPFDIIITLNRILFRQSNDLETLRNRVIYLFLQVRPGTQNNRDAFYDLVMQMADVMTFGAKKYGTENWAKGGSVKLILTACARHLTTWMHNPLDHDTGKSHLVHALCNICFAMYYLSKEEIRKEHDDRTTIYN